METAKQAESELAELSVSIRDWQQQQNYTDARMCTDFEIGSQRTYEAVCQNRFDGLDVDRWLPAYRTAWEQMQLRTTAGEEVPLYDDLTPVLLLRTALVRAMRELGNDRLIILEGDTGSGKTCALDAVRKKYGSRIMICEADETWRDSIHAMLSDLLKGYGVQPPLSASSCMEKLLEKQRAIRRCLVIEEAHHMGPRGLNVIKSIINRSPGEVIIVGLPELLKRMQLDAYQESRQLIHNRLSERITLDHSAPSDVEKILIRSGGIAPAAARQAAKQVARISDARGQLKFVYKLAKRCKEKALAEADAIVKEATTEAARIANQKVLR